MILLNEESAREILDATHDAWSKGEIDRLVGNFTETMIYWSNAGPTGEPWSLEGKDAYAAYLKSIAEVVESVTVSEHFYFSNGIGRAKAEGYIRHRQTGHILSGTFRQIVTFRDQKIARLDEYYDAAKIAAFWRLVMSDVIPKVQ